MFNYNSYHKKITAILIIAWAVYHFTDSGNNNNQYANGQIKKTGSFSNGKNHGAWTWYYENGKKKMQGTFEHGKRTGTWVIWNKKGNKLTESTYEDDQLNGEFIHWNSQGKVEKRLLYKNDVLVEEKSTENDEINY